MSGTGSRALSKDYFIVIGMPVGVNERNRNRRNLLRKLWISEYPNIGKTVRAEFIVGLQTYQGDGHDAETIQGLYEEHSKYGDLSMVNAREATTDPYRGDPKNTGEKLVAWMRLVVVMYANTAFFVKADWDSWIHTVRLEFNLRHLLATRSAPMYFGNTLWCSYSVENFQPCGYGFGPLQAAGSRKVECPRLPGGARAVGPYPYAAGLFWGMAAELVRWIASSRFVYDFAQVLLWLRSVMSIPSHPDSQSRHPIPSSNPIIQSHPIQSHPVPSHPIRNLPLLLTLPFSPV